MIFLGTYMKEVAHESRFLPVYGGKADKHGLPMSGKRNFLLTDPPDAFKTNFHVDLSHPLRVKVIFDVKYIDMPLQPPPVGMKCHRFESTSTGEVRLNPNSEATFWEIYRRYHNERPKASGGQAVRWSTGIDGLGVEGCLTGGGEVEVVGASQEVDAVEGGEGQSIHAPYGMIGGFRIGFDIPLVLSNVSDSSEGDSEEDSDDEWKTVGDQEDLSASSAGTTDSDAYDHITILREIDNEIGGYEIAILRDIDNEIGGYEIGNIWFFLALIPRLCHVEFSPLKGEGEFTEVFFHALGEIRNAAKSVIYCTNCSLDHVLCIGNECFACFLNHLASQSRTTCLFSIVIVIVVEEIQFQTLPLGEANNLKEILDFGVHGHMNFVA